MKKISYNVRFFALQAFYWAAYCTVYAFTVNILTANGYDSVLCGFILSGIALSSAVVQLLLGYVSDTFFTSKKVLLVMMGGAATISLILPSLMDMPVPVVATAIILMSMMDYSLYPTVDVWSVASMEKHPEVVFTLTRSGGSVGYALTAAIMGVVISRVGVNILFYAHTILLVASMLICLSIEETPCLNSRKLSKEGDSMSLFQVGKKLLKNKTYMLLLVTLSIMYFSYRPCYSYLYLAVQQAGGDSSHQGLAVMIGSSLEIAGMMISHRMRKKNYHFQRILAVGMFCGAVRMFTLAMPLGVWALIVLQSFLAVSYGCFLGTFTEYVCEITSPKYAATATTIAAAITNNIGTMCGNMVGGYIIRDVGMPLFEIISGCGFLVALGLTLWGERLNRKVA
jgi:PPP family 3-phenylpropionic acid transporter